MALTTLAAPRIHAQDSARSTPVPGDSGSTGFGAVPSQAWSVPTTFRLEPVGSNANFNPLSMLVNRGFDIWLLNQYSPNVFQFPWAASANRVWHAVTHPSEGIRAYGASKFWNTQVLPLTITHSDRSQSAWMPNYTLHFFQGGVTFVRTEGWLADRGWPAPRLLSGLVVMGAAYLTEMVEADRYDHAGAATFADLVFFDLGGVLVFNIPAVRKFVGERMEVLDWSLQPVLTTYGELHNAGDYFALRLGLPFTDKVDFLWRVGMGMWYGLSVPRNGTDAVSVVAGVETLTRQVDPITKDEWITMGFSGGVFYDRNGSLLASLELGINENVVSTNIYPGVLPGPLRNMGLWFSFDRNMRPRLGLVASPLGIGFGYTPRQAVQAEPPPGN